MPKNRISKAKDGRYLYKVTDTGGKRLQLLSRKSEKLSDFRRRCDALDREAEGAHPEETLDDLFYLWIERHVKRELSPGELRTIPQVYETHVRPFLGHRKLHEITRADVYKLLQDVAAQGKAAATVRNVRSCISRPYNWAITRLGMDLTPPTQGLIFRGGKKRSTQRRALTEEDANRFFDAAKGTKYYRYYQILYMTGLRPSEGLGLQAKDIEGGAIHIRRGVTIDGMSDLKTSAARRDFPLYPELEKVLRAQISDAAFITPESWLFPAGGGMPSMSALVSSFKRTLKQTEDWERGGRNHMKKLQLLKPAIDISLYDFRHTFATRMAEKGMPHAVLKQLMGHESITTTLSYYVDVTDEMMEQAIQLLKEG